MKYFIKTKLITFLAFFSIIVLSSCNPLLYPTVLERQKALSIAQQDGVVKILAIGNSFSEDALEQYLYGLAKAGGYKVIIGNLYIGGQSFEGHWKNAQGNLPNYEFRLIDLDGRKTNTKGVTLQQGISSDNWDYISFQEVSGRSGKPEGYLLLDDMIAYTKKYVTNPNVKYLLHQTWAYAQNSTHQDFPKYHSNQNTMYNAIIKQVTKAKKMNPEIWRIIPSGTTIQKVRATYIGDNLNRDGYHLAPLGRFTASSAWYESIFGDVDGNYYSPEELEKRDVETVKEIVYKSLNW